MPDASFHTSVKVVEILAVRQTIARLISQYAGKWISVDNGMSRSGARSKM